MARSRSHLRSFRKQGSRTPPSPLHSPSSLSRSIFWPYSSNQSRTVRYTPSTHSTGSRWAPQQGCSRWKLGDRDTLGDRRSTARPRPVQCTRGHRARARGCHRTAASSSSQCRRSVSSPTTPTTWSTAHAVCNWSPPGLTQHNRCRPEPALASRTSVSCTGNGHLLTLLSGQRCHKNTSPSCSTRTICHPQELL